MKTACNVDQVGFVDINGKVFTPEGVSALKEYLSAAETITEPRIFTHGNNVAILVPVEGMTFQGVPIRNCLAQAAIKNLFAGLLIETTPVEMTFFNLYHIDGESLTDNVLGQDTYNKNLFAALDNVTFEDGYSKSQVIEDFKNSQRGIISFTLNLSSISPSKERIGCCHI